MNRTFLWVFVGAGALAATVFAYGCVVADTCEGDGTCPSDSADGGADAAAAPDSSGIGSCGDGGTCFDVLAESSSGEAAVDAFVCDPTKDPKDEPCVLDDAYGVFVASQVVDGGLDGGDSGPLTLSADGTMSHPYATIGQALANRGKKTRIYVCNGFYAEQVSLLSPVNIYGGLSCAAGPSGSAWLYVGGGARVDSPSSAYALSVTVVDSGSVTVEDMVFTSPTAVIPGGSSIAALVVSSAVNLQRVTLTAGSGASGAAGADGASIPNYAGPSPSGGAQVWTGAAGNGFVPISGGPGAVNRCSQYGSSAGGDGGLGCTPDASGPGVGTVGSADPAAPATTAGRDGLSYGSVLPDGGTNLAANDPGGDGLAGDGGGAPPALIFGTLLPVGWTPSAGGDGAPGNPGQGGAGATDPLYGACGAPTESIGGGGGGAGGCGGASGKGGAGGGASIALIAVGATVDLKQCVLSAATAGVGGAGGAGQDGQAGGTGGDDMSFPQAHSPGAPGGNGAGGSGGAGGTGGVSIGVLYTGTQVSYDTSTGQSIALGPPGLGGVAGPAGKRPTAAAPMAGSDGNPGQPGNAGTAAAFFEVK